MLTFHSTAAKDQIPVDPDASALPAGVNWIDALQPDAAENAFLKRVLGVEAPTFERLSEIETSRRLYRRGEFLFMSIPAIVRRTDAGLAETAPIGFVLAKNFVLTVRYSAMRACEDLYDDIFDDERPANGPFALIQLVEAIIDECSDELEKINSSLDALSRTVFDQGAQPNGKGPSKNSEDLRRVLTGISSCGYTDSKIDDVLLGLARLLPFVVAEAGAYLAPEEKSKFKSLARDIKSLQDYGRVQSERIQFLLDATLGLTNVDQNNIFRLLTVVSVIGIPPTLVASIYGMNFKFMPELEWTFGYEWGLGLILISALIPAIWFKRRGWW
jgi:magnesium transporter